MLFRVRSAKDAADALSYFNHFHDTFLESLTVSMIPEDSEGFGVGLPVRYEATLGFLHTNYPAAEEKRLRHQRVQMRLSGIRSLGIGDVVASDNMLQNCLLRVGEDGVIHVDVGGDGLVTFTCEILNIEELDSGS